MLPTPESLGLPSRPGAQVAAPEPASASTSTPALVPSVSSPAAASTSTASTTAPFPSSSASTTCAQCDTPPKYTCPRCAARTCSLPCSKLHKSRTGCSGVRDPAAFVPLNKITQGTWDSDYAWLEQRRRQVTEWGSGITLDEATRAGVDVSLPGRGGPNNRGGKSGQHQQQQGRQKKSKLDGLRWAITELGADVDLLPDGMGRRRTNQSSWNPKTRALNLTIQFTLPPSDDEPTLLSHPRVPVLPSTTATLASLLPEKWRQGTELLLAYHVPRWRERQRERIERNERYAARRAGNEEATVNTVAVAESLPAGKKIFPPLDANASLTTAFAGTAFVEFPTVVVVPAEQWEKDKGGYAIMPLFEVKKKPAEGDNGDEEEDEADEGRAAKRTKVETAPTVAEAETAPASGPALGSGSATTAVAVAPRPGPVTTMIGGLGGLADYASGSEDDVDDEAGGDVELSPEMAAALGKAIEADGLL